MTEHFDSSRGLVQVVKDTLWVKQVPLRFFGIQIGTRMTIVRFPDQRLFIHSPVALTPLLKAEIARLGKVFYVVSPNNMHHLFIGDYFEAYKTAKIYASPGLFEKRRDLEFHRTLKDKPELDWESEIDQTIFYGHSTLKEVVFFHKRTRTLILADLIMNFQENSSPLTKFVAQMGGMYQVPSAPLAAELTEAQKAQAAVSVKKILEWDFDRIILAHGKIIETDGKEIFRQIFSEFL
jgi:hypothetical protein